MDINHLRFPTEFLKIVEQIAESHFVSFDLEFSGVAGRRQHAGGKLTLQDVYTEVREAALKYQVLQVGITIVQEDLRRGRRSHVLSAGVDLACRMIMSSQDVT